MIEAIIQFSLKKLFLAQEQFKSITTNQISFIQLYLVPFLLAILNIRFNLYAYAVYTDWIYWFQVDQTLTLFNYKHNLTWLIFLGFSAVIVFGVYSSWMIFRFNVDSSVWKTLTNIIIENWDQFFENNLPTIKCQVLNSFYTQNLLLLLKSILSIVVDLWNGDTYHFHGKRLSSFPHLPVKVRTRMILLMLVLQIVFTSLLIAICKNNFCHFEICI